MHIAVMSPSRRQHRDRHPGPPKPSECSAPAVITPHPQALWFPLPSFYPRQSAQPPAGIQVLRIKLGVWMSLLSKMGK